MQLALARGAHVFATASRAKRPYLAGLGLQHVFDSRSAAFADEVLTATGGQGVHVVLNSLTGEMFDATLRVLGPGARFVEIGWTDDWDPERLHRLRPDAQFTRFRLLEAARDAAAGLGAALREVVSVLETDALCRLPTRVFAIDRVVEAFRYMAQARHVGKIAVSLQTGKGFEVVAEASYLVTGGFGALGMQVARWLVAKGAKRIILVGRRLPEGESVEAIKALRESGAQVEVVRADVTSEGDIQRALAAAGERLRGIVHAAGTLDDGVLVRQNPERFDSVLAPKVLGALHLHRLTQRTSLDFFVLFSSLSGLLGTLGQGSYAAANAFLDALAHERRALGLPATSVAWGAWAGRGMAAALPEAVRRERAERGLGEIPVQQGLRILECVLEEGRTHVAVAPVDWTRYARSLGAEMPFFLSRLAREGASRPRTGDLGSPVRGGGQAAAAASDPALHRPGGITQFLREHVAAALGIAPAALPVDQPLARLGLDSLAAIELRNRIQQSLGLAVPMVVFLTGGSIARLAEKLVELQVAAPAASPVGADRVARQRAPVLRAANPRSDGE